MKARQQLLAGLILAGTLAGNLAGQSPPRLAITEVMTKATMNQYPAFRGTDFWELTNLGTNEVNLTGYGFRDSHTDVLINQVFSGLVIRAGESIIFVNTEPSTYILCRTTNSAQFIQSAAAFKQWWGAANLPVDLRVFTYAGSRFSDAGDELWLFDPRGAIVDAVTVGPATPGRTFVYEPSTGVFGSISLPGQAGTIKAAWSDDYGSPGTINGQAPLQILQQPQSQTIEIGLDVTLSMVAGGLPQPQYQWTYQGTPLANCKAAILTLSNVGPAQAGDYQVIVSNGTARLVSAVATLTVNTNAYVKILRPPANLTAYDGQMAQFTVVARGHPQPSYQWQENGVDIPGATDTLLPVFNCTPAVSGNVYTVRVWNQGCSTNAAARLVIAPRPRLAVTELMTCTSYGHADWFELTNDGTTEIDLQGYRFFDRKPTNGEPFASFIESTEVLKITNSFIIKPRESVIFVHKMTAEDFVHWWGKANLPPGLQIHTYSGFALSSAGEFFLVWNAAAIDTIDRVATITWPSSGMARSWEINNTFYDSEGYDGMGENASEVGIRGAWAATVGGDIGSPGVTTNTPPHFLGISTTPAGVTLKCRGNPGKSYRLFSKTDLAQAQWLPGNSRLVTNAQPFILLDTTVSGNATRFYRLEELP